MRTAISPQSRTPGTSILWCVRYGSTLLIALILSVVGLSAQNSAPAPPTKAPAAHATHKTVHRHHSHPAATPKAAQHRHSRSSQSHKAARHAQASPPVVAAPPQAAPAPPPAPNWPVNDHPNQASVIWDSHGLKIEAQNSSLQQILNDVAVETGAKIEGMGADQRVFGAYGPGQARDVLSQLLQGSGYNVLLAGDLGQGAPRAIMLSPRRANGASTTTIGRSPQDSVDDDTPDNTEVEEQPEPPQPAPVEPSPGAGRPGFGPNGPVRTPQQVMQEMQQQQLQQQQQQLQQQQQPQQQDTPPVPPVPQN